MEGTQGVDLERSPRFVLTSVHPVKGRGVNDDGGYDLAQHARDAMWVYDLQLVVT